MRGRVTGGRRAAAAQAVRREDPSCGGCCGRAGAERTKNIISMVVTLEVSQFNDWLNAAARCRVERGAWEEGRHTGPGDGRAWGDGGASSAQGGP